MRFDNHLYMLMSKLQLFCIMIG